MTFILNFSRFKKPVFWTALLTMTLTLTPQRAEACYCATEPWPCTQMLDIDSWWNAQTFTSAQQNYLTDDFYQQKIINEFWTNNVRPALQGTAAQIISARVYTTGMIGGFMDAQSALDSQLTMQRLHAGALRDYTPGENLCRLGTGVRSVAAAEMKAETALYALDEMTEDRLMQTRGGHSDGGPDSDNQARFNQFARLYCNPGDNNGFMKQLCYPKTTAPDSKGERFNKDIDPARTLTTPMTLDLNFTDGVVTPDEEDLLALSHNLYGHNILPRVPSAIFSDSPGDPNRPTYLDVRQIAALRSVAQHSFNAQAAMKARGANGSAIFLKNVLREMGMSDDEAKRYLDSTTDEPSYNAQMEILTKKIYQNPNFYVNLIDKPANVKRQLAAMNAIGLSQNRDLFDSLQRQELLLSLMLELEIRQEAQRIENDKASLETK